MERKVLYLDTSVPSAFYDDSKPDRQELTKEFWNKLKNYTVVISAITAEELDKVREHDSNKAKKLGLLVKDFEYIEVTEETKSLARAYIENEVIPKTYENDALHIAVATLRKVNYLISWNFKHLVNLSTREKVQAINVLRGYSPIEIIAPPELGGD